MTVVDRPLVPVSEHGPVAGARDDSAMEGVEGEPEDDGQACIVESAQSHLFHHPHHC